MLEDLVLIWSGHSQAAVRKEVAAAIIKAACSVKSAEITPDKVVVRFGEFAQRFGR